MIEVDEEAVGTLLDALQPGAMTIEPVALPTKHGAFVVVRDGHKVHELKGPTKKARQHVFHDLGSFAEWLNRHAVKDANTVEILASETEVVAALAPVDPSGDVVRCLLKLHPVFEAWVKVFGVSVAMSQRDLHQFLRANQKALATGEDGAPGAGDVLMTELQKMNVIAGRDMKTELDERGFYQFGGATERANVTGAIPPRFNIFVPVFIGVHEDKDEAMEIHYSVEILLTMNVVDTAVTFRLSCPALPVLMHQARLDAVAYLKKLLDAQFLVGLGAVQLAEVPLITK